MFYDLFMGNISIYGELKRVYIFSKPSQYDLHRFSQAKWHLRDLSLHPQQLNTLELRTFLPKCKKLMTGQSNMVERRALIYRPAARGEVTDGSVRAHLCLFTPLLHFSAKKKLDVISQNVPLPLLLC